MEHKFLKFINDLENMEFYMFTYSTPDIRSFYYFSVRQIPSTMKWMIIFLLYLKDSLSYPFNLFVD
jgi:hypothetical protein